MGCPCPQQREVDQGQYFFERTHPRTSLSHVHQSSQASSFSSSGSSSILRRRPRTSQSSVQPEYEMRRPEIINVNPNGQPNQFLDIGYLFQIYVNFRQSHPHFFQQDFMAGFIRFLQMIHQPAQQNLGLTQQQIQALRRQIASNDSSSCSICQDTIKKGQQQLLLNCSHTFHTDCLTEWLVRSNKCPMCRQDVA